ncbi:hypothetical protein QMO17_32265, partial [Klebsiella pneumoniae]|nr:hypothetical protein [Klebsiella pneumoniae]
DIVPSGWGKHSNFGNIPYSRRALEYLPPYLPQYLSLTLAHWQVTGFDHELQQIQRHKDLR